MTTLGGMAKPAAILDHSRSAYLLAALFQTQGLPGDKTWLASGLREPANRPQAQGSVLQKPVHQPRDEAGVPPRLDPLKLSPDIGTQDNPCRFAGCTNLTAGTRAHTVPPPPSRPACAGPSARRPLEPGTRDQEGSGWRDAGL